MQNILFNVVTHSDKKMLIKSCFVLMWYADAMHLISSLCKEDVR